MIIRKMTANFGVLNGRTLELKPGLNVIEGGNEFGKSTWCAFLRAMLYGMDTTQREKNGRKPEKLLYAPWDGSAMEGSMELSSGDEELTVVRKTILPNAPMRSLEVFRSGTANRLPEWENSDLGERLTGATAALYARTAFIGTGSLSVSQTPELERRIAAILSTGEEKCSYSEADGRLQTWQRALRYRSQGRLPEIERKMEELEERLAAISGVSESLARLDEEEKSLQSESERIAQQTAADERMKRIEIADVLRRGRERVTRTGEAASEKKAQADALADGLSEGYLQGRPFDAKAEEKAVRASTDAALAQERAERGEVPVYLRLLPMVLGGIAGVLDWRFASSFLLFAAVILCTISVGLLFREPYRRRERLNAEARLSDILEFYGVSRPEEILPAVHGYAALWEKYHTAKQAAEAAEDAANEAKRELQKAVDLADRILTAEKEFSPEYTDRLERLQVIRSERERLCGRLEVLGDPMAIRSALGELEEEHKAKTLTYAALGEAITTLAQTNSSLQSVFCPQLSKKAVEYFTVFTDHAYHELTVSSTLSALVRRAGDVTMHEESYLSRGTVDQLYFSLRLALCDLLLSGKEPCPLVLDDALLNFDEARMGKALQLLQKLSRTRQILLFTCQKREKQYLNSHPSQT